MHTRHYKHYRNDESAYYKCDGSRQSEQFEIFDEDETIQESALDAIEQVIPFILILNYKEHAAWPNLKASIFTK